MPSAQRVAWAKFRVFAVTVVALLILSTLVFLLAGATIFEPKVNLYLYIPDATGVVKDAPVRVNGIGVGKVAVVQLSGSRDPNRTVKVTMTIQRNRLPTIAPDSTAQMASDTAIGDKYVAITGGTRPDHVRPNDEIPYKSSEELLKTLDITQFQKQAQGIDALLQDIEQGKNRVGEFFSDDKIYRALITRIDEIERGIKAVADKKNGAGRELYTDQLFQQIHNPLADLDRSLARLQSGEGVSGAFLRDPAQYQGMRDRMKALRDTIAELGKSPYLTSELAYTDWNKLVASLIQKVEDFNATPLMISSAVYEDLNGKASEMRQTTKEFRQNPRKFLRLKVF